MFKELFETVKSVNGHSAFVSPKGETYWIVNDKDISVYGPFDEKSEDLIKDRFIKMSFNGKYSGDRKLIKSKDNFPKDTRGYKFKDIQEVMSDNLRLSNKEMKRLKL